MQMNIKVSTSWHYCFDGSGHISPKYPKQQVGDIFAKSVAAAFVFYCEVKHSDILRGSSHVYCYLVPCTDRLEIFSLNTAIQQLNSNYVGRGFRLCCYCSKLMFLNRSRVYCSKLSYAHQKSQKKACIRSYDTNNFIQILTRKYHHTATESLYRPCGEKISWTSTLAGVSYQFGFVPFHICLQCKISGSLVFSNFSHEVTDPNL